MTDIEPGQMDIFDILEDVEPEPKKRLENKEEAPTAGLLPKRRTEEEKALGLKMRINEYHFDKRFSSKEFIDWANAAGKKIGDFYRLEDIRNYYKKGAE